LRLNKFEDIEKYDLFITLLNDIKKEDKYMTAEILKQHIQNIYTYNESKEVLECSNLDNSQSDYENKNMYIDNGIDSLSNKEKSDMIDQLLEDFKSIKNDNEKLSIEKKNTLDTTSKFKSDLIIDKCMDSINDATTDAIEKKNTLSHQYKDTFTYLQFKNEYEKLHFKKITYEELQQVYNQVHTYVSFKNFFMICKIADSDNADIKELLDLFDEIKKYE